ncbi:unnamed protein product [Echinostoma caproni]|uniref:RNase H domain-containing protein n=1 Tax=Echinostoma caproni TaxID=27848 RepID=A0A183AKP7_9TREM|nr:unnamed protein product [Echinostoma caproni]
MFYRENSEFEWVRGHCKEAARKAWTVREAKLHDTSIAVITKHPRMLNWTSPHKSLNDNTSLCQDIKQHVAKPTK